MATKKSKKALVSTALDTITTPALPVTQAIQFEIESVTKLKMSDITDLGLSMFEAYQDKRRKELQEELKKLQPSVSSAFKAIKENGQEALEKINEIQRSVNTMVFTDAKDCKQLVKPEISNSEANEATNKELKKLCHKLSTIKIDDCKFVEYNERSNNDSQISFYGLTICYTHPLKAEAQFRLNRLSLVTPFQIRLSMMEAIKNKTINTDNCITRLKDVVVEAVEKAIAGEPA